MLKICFDLDGVLCKTKSNNYHKSVPIKKNISFVNSLYKNYYIIIFTARFMGRSNDLEKIAIKKGLSLTKKQLKKWGVKYHKLKMGKPSYDIFVDDKSLFFKTFWINDLKKKIFKLKSTL
jgi:hypothetical protein